MCAKVRFAEQLSVTRKTCDLCQLNTNNTDDLLVMGDWMMHQNLAVHYFCLLHSYHLPQRGSDASGILGFLVRDIRQEMRESAKRVCCFCGKPNASTRCHNCKDYFHVRCGYYNESVFYFADDFRAYCDNCAPLTDAQRKFMQEPALTQNRCCSICRDSMGQYRPRKWIYGECCGNGFAHLLCMRKYALRAGYYLKCIWCKSKRFRDLVRLQSVFVPDRDADWEREKHAYRDLHRGHGRCDMEKCHCPRGRECDWGKWSLIRCSLCGSFGAHNPICITNNVRAKEKLTEFKCDTCKSIEQHLLTDSQPRMREMPAEQVCMSLFVSKRNNEVSEIPLSETPSFSGGETQTQLSPCNRSDELTEHFAVPTATSTAFDVTAATTVNTQQFCLDLCTQATETETAENATQSLADDDIVSAIYAEVCNLGIFKQYADLLEDNAIVDENLITLNMLEFNADASKCLAACQVRVNANDARFAGNALTVLQNEPQLLNESDILARSTVPAPFKALDALLENFKTSI